MLTDNRLEGAAAVVTGASGGIGRAIAVALSRRGANLCLASRNARALRAAAAAVKGEGGREPLLVAADVTQEGQVKALMERVWSAFGRLDILVNSAGSMVVKPLEETSEGEWDATLDVNLKAPFLCAKYAVPYMLRQGGGAIVNIASVAGVKPFPNSSAYCASKFGLVGLSQALSQELRGRGIRVLAVCPGAVDTELWDRVDNPLERSRMLRPEEVAEAVVGALTFSSSAVVDLLVITPKDGIL